MYSLYKYHEVMTMERDLQEVFKDINLNEEIDILPPIIKTYKGKKVLAFLVVPEPKNSNHHMAVYRPIGAIFRKLKSKKIVKVINCAEEEFSPRYNDFLLEHYDLESHPEYWPNRSPENEEKYRVALEKLLKIVQTMKFGIYSKKLYNAYLDMIYEMFPTGYIHFFEELAHNPIVPLSDEIIYQRELAQKEHEVRMQKLREKSISDTSFARQKFLKKIKEHLQYFIRKEILPTLKNKPGYTKLDFYRFAGKLYKEVLLDEHKYISCYDASLTKKAMDANFDDTKERLNVLLIKTYAKACVNPGNTDEGINAISLELIKFMDTMLLQEVTNNVSTKSKETIKMTMIKIERMLGRLPETTAKNTVAELYEDIKNDYFNGLSEKEMSDIYLGCMLTDIVI